MKNKKYFYGLLVALLLLCAGIGYAAISSTLTINGSASTASDEVLKNNLKVYFTEAKDFVDSGSIGIASDAEISTTDNKIATVEATGYYSVGQTTKVCLKISNESADFDATVSAAVTAGTGTLNGASVDFSDYFTMKQYFVSAASLDAAYALASGADTIDIASGSVAYIIVEITLKALPTNQLSAAEFTISLTATAK